jgi:short-subunit dehydrogenase
MTDLAAFGPWAVITGASSGIGQAFAEQLATRKINLLLAARSTERLERLGDRLCRAHGVTCLPITTDLSRPDGARRVIEAAAELDVGLLISNAGTGRPGRYIDQDLVELQDRLRLNTTTHLELTHAFAGRLATRGRGGMILVSAHGAIHGLPNMAHDGATKAYVHSLGEALHRELAPAGVTVTVMLPGNVDTPVIQALGIDGARLPLPLLPADVAARQALTALRRGRTRIVPDQRLRLIGRLAPRSVTVRLNERMLGAAARTLAERSTGRHQARQETTG